MSLQGFTVNITCRAILCRPSGIALVAAGGRHSKMVSGPHVVTFKANLSADVSGTLLK